jgi:hypothetical protein
MMTRPNQNPGASKVETSLPDTYKGLKLGSRAATAIFMYSFSGKSGMNGATESEIKRETCYRGKPSSLISEVLNHFRNHLFYLNTYECNKYLFTKEASMLKMKIDRMENIREQQLLGSELKLLEKNVSNQNFKVRLWPKVSKDIENSSALKLFILRENNMEFMRSLWENVNESPRTYKNNIFFPCPSETERHQFTNTLRSRIAGAN